MLPADTLTDEDLAIRVAMKQARMATLDPFAVARAERLLLEQPGREQYRRRHRTTTAAGEAEQLLHRHRDAILAGALARIAAVDPAAVAARPVHVVDFDAFGARSEAVGGFTLADGGWTDLRAILPADAKPGPVVALNVRAEIVDAVRFCPADATETEIVEAAAAIVHRTALHEYAHVVDCEAAGQIVTPDLELAGPPDLAHVVRALAAPRPIADSAAAHGPQWVRALYHAHRRDAWRRRNALDIDAWWDDVARYVPGDPGDLAAALVSEWRDADRDEPLALLLRRPSPPAFLSAFPSQEPTT